MNYNNAHVLELKDILSTYLFELSKVKTAIQNNEDCLKEFKDVVNFQQMKDGIGCTNLIYRNSVEFIEAEIKKVLQRYFSTNVESYKFYKDKNMVVVDFGHDFECIILN
jgi:hypothetical protein